MKTNHEDITELKLDHPGATDPTYRARYATTDGGIRTTVLVYD